MFKKLPCLKVNLESLKAQLLQELVRVDIHLENLSQTTTFLSLIVSEIYARVLTTGGKTFHPATFHPVTFHPM